MACVIFSHLFVFVVIVCNVLKKLVAFYFHFVLKYYDWEPLAEKLTFDFVYSMLVFYYLYCQ